jgi:hypothetical protein
MAGPFVAVPQTEQLAFHWDNFSMPPAKTRRKNQHHQVQPATTDYDSDANLQAATNYDVTQRTIEDLNFSVLQRYLPFIHSILGIANYAVLYTFNPSAQAWQKADIEGTLFVCAQSPALNATDEYCAIILNRRGLENFVVKIQSRGDIEVSGEYLYLRSEANGETYGLWIFSEEDTSTAHQRDNICSLITELAKQAEVAQLEISNQLESEQTGRDATEDEVESVSMGRQLSLRDLFGQQREQDSGFAVHSHQSPRSQKAQPALHPHQHAQNVQGSRPASTIAPPTAVQVADAPKPVLPSQFQMSADTAFFMSGPSGTPQSSAPSLQQPYQHGVTGKANGDALLALFKSAK